MKKFGVIVFVVVLFIGCNSARKTSINQVQQLSKKLDSVSMVYMATDWDYYKKIATVINSDMAKVKKYQEQIMKIDPDFVHYAGPYSAAEKTIGRLSKKKRNSIEKELAYSKTQLENLVYDIRKKVLTNADTMNIYIVQEQQAINDLNQMVSDLNRTLKMQEEAYNLLQQKVSDLIAKIDTTPKN
jgi:DNA-directed RNA polymerase beta' subunit